jgi:cytochrome c-type biogenesis protein CcmH
VTARSAAILVAIALWAGAAGPVGAQENDASPGLSQPAPSPKSNAALADIEDEVMCPICGTTLQLSQSPQADRERAFIQRLIADGKTKDEIKDALVAEYGSEVLALPDTEGFDLAAWLVPGVALVLAAVAIGLGLRRWRRREGPVEEAAPIEPEDRARLDSDLARYDL